MKKLGNKNKARKMSDEAALMHANGVFGAGKVWQSARDPQIIFQNIYNEIINLALSRFKWKNLPKGCDARYLEWVLLTQGVATIAFPKRAKGSFLSLMMVQQGQPNIYNNPSRWRAQGQNGSIFSCDYSNGVIVYDNLARYPLIRSFEFWASDLTDIYITRRLNRLHQKIPFFLEGEPQSELTLINTFKQIDDGESAILTYSNITKNINKLDNTVPYIGDALDLSEQNAWNRVYRALGIATNSVKMERQIEDEVVNQNAPNDLHMSNPLMCRRAMCEDLNSRFEKYLDAPVNVVWNEDLISENYNYMNSVRDVANNGE